MSTRSTDTVESPGANVGLQPAIAEELLRVLSRVRAGDLSARLPDHWDGIAGRVADAVNEIVADNERLTRELERVGHDELIPILAHELRNPLSAIRSGVELMHLPELTPGKMEWARNLVQRQTEHLVRLIDDLLDVSRVTSGRVQLKREAVDLRQVVVDAVDAMRARIDERGHSVAVELPDEPLFVDGDPVRLAQVLCNLLANAAQYMDFGGRITIGAGRAPDARDRVVVQVTDEGSGLDTAMLERIFELFAQDRPAGGRTQGGLGIGLALVRRLVELHEGSARADSEGPGKGSTFTVELPLTQVRPPS